MEVHEFNKIIPAMTREEYTELRADIKAHGVIQSILLYEDKILDGGHRWKAAKETGQECPSETFEGTRDEAIDRVVSLNINRRHLSASQKSLLGADVAALKQGGSGSNQYMRKSQSAKPSSDGFASTKRSPTTARVAKALGVSTASIERARALKREAPEKVVAEVRAGTKTVSRALREVRSTGRGRALAPVKVRKGPDLKGLERIAVEHGLPADTFSSKSQTQLSIPIKKEHLKRLDTAAKLQGTSPQEMVAEFVATSIEPTSKPADEPTRPAARLDQVVLTREQVDPDFKGTDQEFTRKYGRVPLRTKKQIDTETMVRRGDALVVALRDFIEAVPADPTEDDLMAWLRHDDRPSRWEKLQERITGFRAYINKLLPVLASERIAAARLKTK